MEAQAALMVIGFSGLLFKGSIISTRLWGAKAFIDLTGQTLANRGDFSRIDVLDLGLSASTIPGFSAMMGSLIDFKPLADKDRFKAVGFNKSYLGGSIDFGFKYSFGSLGIQGLAGRYTYGQLAKGSLEELLTTIMINSPINWSGKILRRAVNEHIEQ